MIDVSFHILDLVQNSIKARATSIKIQHHLTRKHRIITIIDNGCGIKEEDIPKVVDPFFTSRTTRKIGMGLPLFQETCEQAKGSITIKPLKTGGTVIRGFFEKDHIDAAELGNIGEALYLLLLQNKEIDICYYHQVGEHKFYIDARELYQKIEHKMLYFTEVMQWIEQYINEQIQLIEGDNYENIRRIKSFAK